MLTLTGQATIGSPPRVWGKYQMTPQNVAKIRFTPTGVGKMNYLHEKYHTYPVHPHGCGENTAADVSTQDTRRFTPTGVGKMYIL